MLVDGIKSQSGTELFNSVRYSTAPPGPSFFGGLDTLFQASPLQRGDVVEIQGATGSGKTSFLYFLCITAILPSEWTVTLGSNPISTSVGGKGQSVAFLDCTQRFSITRLATLLREHLSQALEVTVQDHVIDDQVRECLKRLHVFSPHSTVQLAATLQRLPSYFTSEAASATELAYVLIDGSSEFFWADQYERERSLNGAKGKAPAADPAGANVDPLRLLVSSLAHVRSTLSPIIVLSQWVLRDATVSHLSQEGLPLFAHHLPAPYPRISNPFPPIDPADPMRPPILPNSEASTVPLKWHIMTFAPPVKKLLGGGTFREALARRKAGRGKGMQGIKAVLRAAGGKEVGSWEWDVLERSVYG